MTLAMSWDEWAAHDALGLAQRVRAGDDFGCLEFTGEDELWLAFLMLRPRFTTFCGATQS